uniref:Terminase n=1 Tax=Saimiriine herpesvirus 2 (strain 488) TaxID=10384 RepID=Q80BP8_SHV2C|nr:terminase [Saimiriine gammaherpesvirus 2]
MLMLKAKKAIIENLSKVSSTQAETDWDVNTPTIITNTSKSERTAYSKIGVIPSVNLYSSTLTSFCKLYHPLTLNQTQPQTGTLRVLPHEKPLILQDLSSYVKSLTSQHVCYDTEANTEYNAAVQTQQTSMECPTYIELRQFVINLSSFLNGCYVKRSTHIEPFQLQLILHTFYFLISIKSPESTNRLFDIFKEYFGLKEMDSDMLQIFKQKASIFLIPRRHGKTWIVVAIISMLLTSVENIHVGYVAHQKHVANSVFTEIINTLQKWFPSRYIDIKKENGTIIYKSPDKKPSTLMCATCFNKNSIRGQTFNLLYIDEANFIKKDSLPAILGFMLQKDAKLIFISSVNSGDRATSFLFNLKNASEKMLNIVNYICPDHKDDFSLQDSLISCPCYKLYIPTYITIDETIKNTTNLFLDGAFTTELMGDMSGISKSNMHKVISEMAITQFDLCRADTTKPEIAQCLNSTMYIYIDPAYTNNSEASGTGIGAILTLKNNSSKCIIVGMEHYFLKDLTGTATYQIASCACSLIRASLVLYPHIQCVHVAVEGNSSQDSAVAISTLINECSPIKVHFIHYKDKTTTMQWPIYMLGAEKSIAFESFIYAINSGTISASQSIISNTIKLSFDPISYLIEQIRSIRCYPLRDGSHTYCAKKRTVSDDVLVAVVMAYFFATSNKHIFKPLNST